MPDADAMSGPGPLLRHAREAQGLTEQEAAERLNLDVSVVAALEGDDLAALGAPVFAKGHLRRYGGLLGIPEERLLASYERASARPEVPSLIPKARQEMAPERGRPKWPWVLGSVLLFLVVAGGIAYLSENGARLPFASQGPRSAEQAEPPASAPLPAGAAAGLDPEAVRSAAASGAAPAVPPAGAAPAAPGSVPVPPGHVAVSLTFAADSWVEIYDRSGQAVLYDLGRTGTQRSIAAAAPLSVALGNAPAVTLLVNGKPAGVLAVPAGSTVARFRIEADGNLR